MITGMHDREWKKKKTTKTDILRAISFVLKVFDKNYTYMNLST